MRTRTLVLVLAAAAAVAVALVTVSLVGSRDSKQAPPAAPAGGPETAELLAGIPQAGLTLGKRDAPVTLVELADLQCPYCAQWALASFPELVRDYVRGGRVKLVFRGLAFIGPDSGVALRAALAAGRQGKLWNVVELLYRNQGAENSGWVTDGLLRGIGAAVQDLDTGRMLGESGSAAVQAQLDAAGRVADAFGISGTPSFLVGRTGGPLRRLELASLGADAFRPALDDLLRS